MTTTVHLHIGMPKCASSSVQAHFWDNYDAYRQQGLLYPRTACDTTGYRSHRPLHATPTAELPQRVREIAEEAAAAGCDRILLSSEAFINSHWDRSESAAVLEALQAEFGAENLRLLFLIRDHASFLSSAFAQFIRAGLMRVPPEPVFAHEPLSIIGFANAFRARNGFEIFSYSDLLTRFAGGGREVACDVLSIHKGDCGGGDIIDKLCRLFGVTAQAVGAASNTRLTERQVFCLLHARKRYGFERVKPRRAALIRGVGKGAQFSSPVFRPDAALFERLEVAAAADHAFFTSRFPGPFEAVFRLPRDPDLSQEGRRAPAPKMSAFIDAVMTAEEMTPQIVQNLRRQIFGDGSET